MLSQLLKLRVAGTVTYLPSCCCYICYHHLHKVERGRESFVYQAVGLDQLIRFQKVGTSVQQHLYNISQSSQPYLLAQGSTQSTINSYFIVVDKHALPCKATGSVGAFDKLFKAHYVFGTSYSSSLSSFFTFVQTTIYNIEMGETKETPRVAGENGVLVEIKL
ncbi:uncharacterized protein LOC113075332 [Tachysurus ichikawai]